MRLHHIPPTTHLSSVPKGHFSPIILPGPLFQTLLSASPACPSDPSASEKALSPAHHAQPRHSCRPVGQLLLSQLQTLLHSLQVLPHGLQLQTSPLRPGKRWLFQAPGPTKSSSPTHLSLLWSCAAASSTQQLEGRCPIQPPGHLRLHLYNGFPSHSATGPSRGHRGQRDLCLAPSSLGPPFQLRPGHNKLVFQLTLYLRCDFPVWLKTSRQSLRLVKHPFHGENELQVAGWLSPTPSQLSLPRLRVHSLGP